MTSHNEEVNKKSAEPWEDQFFDPEMTRALSEKKWLAAAVRADVLRRKKSQLDTSQLDLPLTEEQRDAMTASVFLDTMFDDDGTYREDIVRMGKVDDSKEGDLD